MYYAEGRSDSTTHPSKRIRDHVTGPERRDRVAILE
jgi:hypothetical protein